MRLISQDGSTDIPYDRYILWSTEEDNKYKIYAYTNHNSFDDAELMATYATVDNLHKAKRELYYSVRCTHAFFQFPKDENLT